MQFKVTKDGPKTMIIIPRFRSPGAEYVFLLDPVTGNLLAVIYPPGQTGIYRTEAD